MIARPPKGPPGTPDPDRFHADKPTKARFDRDGYLIEPRAKGGKPPPPKPVPFVAPVSAISRPFDVEQLRDGIERVRFEATPEECATLAMENNLPAVLSFKADLAVQRFGKTNVTVTGTVKAKISQVCVVSLDPFDTSMSEDVDMRFAPETEVREAEERAAQRALDEDADDEETIEPPDPIVDDTIDLGQVAAEFFALGLDPYPRKPGIAFQPPEVPALEADVSPFAALAKLKTKPSDPET